MKRLKFIFLAVCSSLFLLACQSSAEPPYYSEWNAVTAYDEELKIEITDKQIKFDDYSYDYEETGQGKLKNGRPFYTIKLDDGVENTIIFLDREKTTAIFINPYDVMEKPTEGDFAFGMQREGKPTVKDLVEKYDIPIKSR